MWRGASREGGYLAHHTHKAKQNMFEFGPLPKLQPTDPMASWDLGGPISLIYSAQSPFWRQGLGHALLALRGSHGESPEPWSAEVRRRKDLKNSTEPERQHLVLGLCRNFHGDADGNTVPQSVPCLEGELREFIEVGR